MTTSSIAKKIFLVYFVLFIIPLAILFLAVNYGIKRDNITKMSGALERAYDQTYSYISDKISHVNKISESILHYFHVNNLLLDGQGPYDIYTQFGAMSSIVDYLSSAEVNEGIEKIYLYVEDDLFFAGQGDSLLPLSEAYASPWYDELVQNGVLWCPASYFADGDNLSLVRFIKSSNDNNRNVAILRVVFSKADLYDILSQNNLFAGNYSFVFDTHGQVVVSSGVDVVDRAFMEPGLMSGPMEVGNERYYYWVRSISETGWHLAAVASLEGIMFESEGLQAQILLFAGFTLVLALVISYACYRAFDKKIRYMLDKIKLVQENKLMEIERLPKDRELRELATNYNYMIRTIKELLAQNYQKGQELKMLEFNMLQAKINPHFLYNLLDLVNWLAVNHKTESVSKVAVLMAKFYKLGLNKGSDETTLDNELTHVASYVELQNIRFGNRICLTVSCADELRAMPVLKLILQPLVENSITHGIRQKWNEEGGIISLSAEVVGEDLCLSVYDNGIGICKEDIGKMLRGELVSNHGSGFGVFSTNQRIKLFYGEDYGLTVESEPGVFCCVHIRLPRRDTNILL